MNLKTSLLKDKKITSEKLRTENKKMELRLQQLKLAMSKEKEERLSNGTQSNWTTGIPGALLNYKPNLSGIDSGKKIRLKMLKEEPIVPSAVRPTNLKSNILKDIAGGDSLLGKNDHNVEQNGYGKNSTNRNCGQCEEHQAAVNCKECAEDYCPKCFAAFHLKGALRKHRSTPISSLNNRVSIPSPLFKPPDLKNISNSASYEKSINSKFSEKPNKKNNKSSQEETEELIESSKENEFPVYLGPSLAEGNYDEESSNQSFQEAIQAWRNNVEINEYSKPYSKLQTSDHSTETVTIMKTKQLLSDLIHFTPSLSYAEQLLLRKHRNNELASDDMKYIINRLAKTNDLELLETQRLLQSNLVLETSLINNTAENALKNNEYHIDFECVNKLLCDAELISSRLSAIPPPLPVESPFKIEELISPNDNNELINNVILQNKNNDNNSEITRNSTPIMNTIASEILPSNVINTKRSKSAIHRNNFYDKPLSARKMSSRNYKGGNITTKPSILLNMLANFSEYLPSTDDDEKTTSFSNKRPKSASVLKSSNKISYNLYKLAPSSWKPSQAWSDEMIDEIQNEIVSNDFIIKNDENLDNDMESELMKLNFLTNEPKEQIREHITKTSSSRSSSSDGDNMKILNNIDMEYFDEETEKQEINDQLISLERELSMFSRQDFETHNNYDEIVTDSLEIANDNVCLASMDSDKFCFEDSLDFEQRYSNNSNTIQRTNSNDDEEEMLINCSSRFDDYDDVHKLN